MLNIVFYPHGETNFGTTSVQVYSKNLRKRKKNLMSSYKTCVRSIKYFRPCFDLILQGFYYKISCSKRDYAIKVKQFRIIEKIGLFRPSLPLRNSTFIRVDVNILEKKTYLHNFISIHITTKQP